MSVLSVWDVSASQRSASMAAAQPVPAAVTDSATGARTYHATTEAHDLRIEIHPTACNDVMSGESYETTVTVTLDGRAYHGCGGPLP